MDYQFDFSFLTTHWREIVDDDWRTLRLAVAVIVFGFLLVVVFVVVRSEVPIWRRRAGEESMPKGKGHVEATFWLTLICQRLQCLVILPQSVDRMSPSLIRLSSLKNAFPGNHEESHGPKTFTGCCHG